MHNRPGILAVLFTGAFVMATAEMLVVGMIELIADDLAVSVAAAGALVTANALGLAVGGPLLTLATARLDRRLVMLVAVGVFALLNLLPVVGAGYPAFLVARVVVGAVQGLFIAAAITTATTIADPHRSGRAMAAIITGSATASALGLPLGTLLGFAVGWRGSFAVASVIAAIVFVVGWMLLPPIAPAPGTRARALARDALAPRVLAILAFCLVIFMAIQAALTYLVPFLAESGSTGAAVGIFLAGYGIATTVGSAFGGRLADANASRTLVVGSVGVAASLVLLLVAGSIPVVAWIAVFGVGLFGMGMAPSMQHRTVHLAGAGAPLAAALPSSAVNAGIAAGSTAGGIAFDAGGASAAVVTAVACSILAIFTAIATSRIRARQDGSRTDAAAPAARRRS